jgi:hypothetical protein
MRRGALPLAVGIVAIALAVLWAVLAREPVMPSYLSAWLVWAGLPIGALTVLLVIELGGGADAAALAALFRPLALGLPLAGLLFIPVLLRLAPLYPWIGGAGPGAPFGRAWLHPGAFIARSIVYLVILSALALVFAAARPAGRRRAGALLALFVVALVATLSSTDWFMSVDPSLHSGEFGLLILAAQCAAATAAAILLGGVTGALPVRPAARLLAVVSAIWLYLHFMQFLVIWSGDLPQEAAWYFARDAAAGRTMEWLAFLGGFVLPVGLLLLPWRVQARALPAIAGLALLAHMLEALWFITPALRHHFALRGPDALLLIGLGGLAFGLALLRPVAAANARGIA